MPIETSEPACASSLGMEGTIPRLDCIGFYSMHFLESIGYCGGYLVLNRRGRPLEFHCTLPVQPNRSQEILYGESLGPHLLCEHIGPPLIQKAKTLVQAVFVDQHRALGLEKQLTTPIVFVNEPAGSDSVSPFQFCQRSTAMGLTESALPQLDWAEPFQRIKIAIEEAHAVAR